MKFKTAVEIDRPQAAVAALLANPVNSKSWMDDLVSYEPLGGEPGMPGSTARYVFKNGKRAMTFTARIISADLPNELRSTLDSPMVHIEAVARLEAVSDTKTRYTFEQNFSFNGLGNKLLGLLASGSIKRQQKRHVEGFKQFANGLSVQ